MDIKKNFAYSSILTISNYIFPLITFPYVSRVLGVTNSGICNFIDGIISYMIIISMMGINIIGVRMSARYKNNQKMLSSVFSGLMLINFSTTILVLVALVTITYNIDELNEYKDLMLIGSIKIVSTLFLCEWFFKGTENFKYITKRSIFIKMLYVIAIFVFVKERNDYINYYLITVLMLGINSIVSCIYIKTKVKLSFNNVIIKLLIRPYLLLGVYAILTSMYTSFNVTYLGFAAEEKEVGYYTTAIKLYAIGISMFSAFTGVMLPRIASLIKENKLSTVKQLIKKSYEILFSFSLPTITFTIAFASEIILLLSGKGYEGAIIPMKIIMPLILIIGIEQILVIQILIPLKKDKDILVNSIVGAAVGVILNIMLVPVYKSVGSAVVIVCSELVVLCAAHHSTKKYVDFEFPYKELIMNIISVLPLYLLYLLLKENVKNIFILMPVSLFTTSVYMLFIQIFFIKNKVILNMINSLYVKFATC